MATPHSPRRDRRLPEASAPFRRADRTAGWRRFGLLAAVAVVCASCIALAVAMFGWREPQPARASPGLNPTNAAVNNPLPWPDSPFLNTREGTYIGSAKCIECHEGEHEGYRHTGMGRSLARLDPESEPPDGVVDHPASSRRYEVVRRDGQMRHRELLLSGSGQETILGDYPISHVIGSGRHSRSYLSEIDGFLVESPVTWYESRRAWGMSPGYDVPYQQGFQRPVDQGCLYCHVGQSRAVDGTLHKMEITEEWLSCERCHGPGSLHVERHRTVAGKDQSAAEGIDRTIVNPVHLPRDLSVDVCAQCHLRSTASISVRGRDLDQYRPGLPMDAFRTDYRFDLPASQMTVVGHVEQLRLSRCFQGSQMTCVTCHNPHAMPRGEARAAYYRSKCLQCHQSEQCKVDPAERARESAENDCVHCHMPSSATDIPHIAFTHHRIGIHDKGALAAAARQTPELNQPVGLVPLPDVSWQSAADRARSLGAAYVEVSMRDEGIRFQGEYQRRAYALLLEAWDAGLKEPQLAAHLAHLATLFEDRAEVEYTQYVLENPDVPGRLRINALLALANRHSLGGQYQEAADAVRQVTRLRRVAGDWALIGQFELRRGHVEEAMDALETSVQIDPMQADVRRELIAHLRRQGKDERARWHEQRLSTAVRAGP